MRPESCSCGWKTFAKNQAWKGEAASGPTQHVAVKPLGCLPDAGTQSFPSLCSVIAACDFTLQSAEADTSAPGRRYDQIRFRFHTAKTLSQRKLDIFDCGAKVLSYDVVDRGLVQGNSSGRASSSSFLAERPWHSRSRCVCGSPRAARPSNAAKLRVSDADKNAQAAR